jgi:phage tail sheath protein FI
MRLLSDVTTSSDAAYRGAAVNRLVSLLVRAARRLGDELTFESNGEALWARLAHRMNDLMTALWEEGALLGKTPQDAFQVRCDRSTMTQNDIDNGRLVASIVFRAAASIEVIAIVLALNEGGQVTLTSRPQLGVAA